MVEMQPRDVATWHIADACEASADNQLAVSGQDHARNRAGSEKSRTIPKLKVHIGKIQVCRTIGIEPRQSMSRNSIHVRERSGDQNFSIRLNLNRVDRPNGRHRWKCGIHGAVGPELYNCGWRAANEAPNSCISTVVKAERQAAHRPAQTWPHECQLRSSAG